MNESQSANESITTQEASERIFQATLRTVMQEQFKYLGKRQLLTKDDTKDEPDAKRAKMDQRPKVIIDVEDKVVVVRTFNDAIGDSECNKWYALSIKQLNKELKPVYDRFPNPECNGNMIHYLQIVCETPVQQYDRCCAMFRVMQSWYKKYYLRETPLDFAGNTRQLWKPLCVVSIDLHEGLRTVKH